MMTKRKRKTHYGLVALLALLLGLLIQVSLGYADYRRETGKTALLLTELGDTAQAAAEAELSARAAQQAAAERTIAAIPAARRDAQSAVDPSLLLVVNRWNPLPEDYEPSLELVASVDRRDYYLDRRCAAAFLQMMEDCRAAGCQPYVCSAYRSQADQQKLYKNKIQRLVWDEGVAWRDAPGLAAQTVAVPGTSEHQLGLAVDIIDEGYPVLDEGQEQTATQLWLMENSWRYGFILRYPNGSTETTGIIYEPWHYRYVGKKPAEEITRMGITLEEYLVLRVGR